MPSTVNSDSALMVLNEFLVNGLLGLSKRYSSCMCKQAWHSLLCNTEVIHNYNVFSTKDKISRSSCYGRFVWYWSQFVFNVSAIENTLTRGCDYEQCSNIFDWVTVIFKCTVTKRKMKLWFILLAFCIFSVIEMPSSLQSLWNIND